MKLLVTTGVKEAQGENEEILFAGDWIKSNINFDQNFKKRKFKIFESIWADQQNLENFRIYLVELRKRLINELSINLNNIHSTKYSLDFWKILIDPWLTYYLEAIYTRWETINKIINTEENLHFIYLDNIESFEAPFDVKHFGFYITSSQIYNQFVFQNIINFFEKKKIKNLKIINKSNKINTNENLFFITEEKKKNYIYKFFNLFLKKLAKGNKFFLNISSLGFNFIFLNFKLNQIPFKDNEFFTDQKYNDLFKNKSKLDLKIRNKISFEFDKKNDFENYLIDNFSMDIPKSLIEDFSSIQNIVKDIPYKPRTIVSDLMHNHETIFKFWIANSIEAGVKLLTTDHGGSFGSIAAAVNYEEEISDVAIRWHKPITHNNVQLPALRLMNEEKRRSKKSKRTNILAIGFEISKYPKNIFISPISGQSLYQIEYLNIFYKNLNQKLKDNFLFRPHPYSSGGWDFEKRFEKIFQKKQIIPSFKKYKDYFKKSKVIVCTYPKTTFCEAMLSGPTILLYKSSYWKNSKEFEPLCKSLKSAKILFEDPILAARHLNEIWENVDEWWESEKVKTVREKFVKEAAFVEPNALYTWKKFLLNYS